MLCSVLFHFHFHFHLPSHTHPLAAADEYTETSGTDAGIAIVNSLYRSDSIDSVPSFERHILSMGSTGSSGSTASSSSKDVINKSFRRSTFASILRKSFKIIEMCTSDSLILEPISSSGRLSDVIKILLTYINAGRVKYFINVGGSTKLDGRKITKMVPVPKFMIDELNTGPRSDYTYVMLTALKCLQNLLSPPLSDGKAPHPVPSVVGSKKKKYPSTPPAIASTGSTHFINTSKSFRALNEGMDASTRRNIIDSMLRIITYRNYGVYAIETSIDVLSKVICYNCTNSPSSNLTISHLVTDAFNTFRETGKQASKLAITMNDDRFIRSVFQKSDGRARNSADTIIETLKIVRKILVHGSSREAQIHGLRIMNAFLAHFFEEREVTKDSPQFHIFEARIRDIIVTKFFTKPILALLADSYGVLEAFKHDTSGKLGSTKEQALLKASRRIMCLSTQYCKNLSVTYSGRSTLLACESDVRKQMKEGEGE